MRYAQPALLTVCIAGYFSLPTEARAQAVSAKEMARCAAITVDARRLACYDGLARNAPAEANAPSAPAPERPEQTFGMLKPPTSKPSGPSRIEAKVLEITDPRDEVMVRLDNDQTWALADGTVMLRVGDAIVIKRAALGSYLMTTPTKRVYRATRLK